MDVKIINFYNDVSYVFRELIPKNVGYSLRQGQLEMALAVARSLAEGSCALIQAGTGVGKTLAYLIPSVIWRLKYEGQSVFISTYTTNLQQQIISQDYPFVNKILGLPFKLVQILGRNRYLCRYRLEKVRKELYLSEEQRKLINNLQEIISYEESSLFSYDFVEREPLHGTLSEFRAKLHDDGFWDDKFWFKICADSFYCLKKVCPYYGRCFFYRDRALINSSVDVFLTNHAYVCSQLQNNSLYPGHYIIDEAHHLEDVAIDQSTEVFNGINCKIFLNSFVNDREYSEEDHSGKLWIDQFSETLTKGWFADVASLVEGKYYFYPGYKDILTEINSLYFGPFSAISQSLRPFSKVLQEFFNSHCQKATILERDWLDKSGGNKVEEQGQIFLASCVDFYNSLSRLSTKWENFLRLNDIEIERDSVKPFLDNALERTRQFNESFVAVFDVGEDESIGHWMESNRHGVSLKAANFKVNNFLQERFYPKASSLVMTSATLQIDKNFEFIQERLGLDKLNVDTLIVSSPFNYKDNVVLGIANDLCRSRDDYDYFITESVKFIKKVAQKWQGKTLVLATSYMDVNFIFPKLQRELQFEDITVLKQSSGTRARYVERLRNAKKNKEKLVLIGTSSFWEGVDIPGEALSCVIILNLPFEVPDNPLFCLRSRNFGENSFGKYALPLAVLKFCQGFGRLVRTESDRGAVFLLDDRLDPQVGKSYRSKFLKAIPECKVIFGPHRELIEQVLHSL